MFSRRGALGRRIIRIMIRMTGVTLAAALAWAMLLGGNSAADHLGQAPEYASFREVPGVTDDEIKAVETLRAQGVALVFGMPATTEAFCGEDGGVRGFSALFCQWLTELFGLSFSPAIYERGELLSGLESGAIDFTGEMPPAGENSGPYITTGAIAERPLKYIRLEKSPPVSEIAAARPLRLAFLDGSDVYARVVSSNVPDAFEPLFAQDNEAAHRLLESGEADAILEDGVLEAAFDAYGRVTTEDFLPLINSPVALATQNPALEPLISVVRKALKNGPLARLYSQGRLEYLRHKLFMRLSDEEKAYIRTSPVAAFAAEIDNYPLCFYNAQEGRWQGIAFEVIEEIEALTGITFKMANVNNQPISWPAMVKMLEDGEVAMLTELIRTEGREGRFIWPETAIITDNFALLSTSEFPHVSAGEILNVRVGLPRGTAYTEFFKTWFPGHENTLEYESSESAFRALDRGEVDMVMSSQYRFLLLTNYRGLPGYKANVVFGRTFNSTFGFNRDERVLCSIIDKALALIDIKEISGRWLRKTFDYRVKLMRARMPLLIGAPVLALALVFLGVIFQRKRHESKRLEILVEKRTAECAKAALDLEAALVEAKAASRAKTSFLANVSHEIRTPMNSIVGFSELAMYGNLAPKTRDYLAKIMDSSKRLMRVINDILDISKIESGKMELEKKPFELSEICEQCRAIINKKAAKKNLSLSFYVEPLGGQKLLGDSPRLGQTLVNLMSNAVKFTSIGGVKFSAAVINSAEGRVKVRFEIVDSGIGLEPDQIERVLEPFTQAEAGPRRQYGGMGLGLPISRGLIEMMGGRLAVESAPGLGTRFSFELDFETA